MGKTFDEILSIGSDVLGFVPGFEWAPIAGNAISGGLQNGPEGALLGGAEAFGGQQLGNFLGNQVGAFGGNLANSITGAGAADINDASALGLQAGGLAGQVGAGVATSQLIDPALASALGLNTTSSGTAAPKSSLAATAKPGAGSGGGGVSGAPGALTGAAVPGIYPWNRGG